MSTHLAPRRNLFLTGAVIGITILTATGAQAAVTVDIAPNPPVAGGTTTISSSEPVRDTQWALSSDCHDPDYAAVSQSSFTPTIDDIGKCIFVFVAVNDAQGSDRYLMSKPIVAPEGITPTPVNPITPEVPIDPSTVTPEMPVVIPGAATDVIFPNDSGSMDSESVAVAESRITVENSAPKAGIAAGVIAGAGVLVTMAVRRRGLTDR